MDSLTAIEQSELSRLEGIIERGQQTFIEVGAALMKIRDSGLYKMYETFERYCKERWGYSRPRAYQLIESVKVQENLSTIVDKPIHESQIRPLTHLEPEKQKEAWKKAVETAPEGKVTAKHVQEVVNEMQGVEPKKTRTVKDTKNLSQLKFYWKKASTGDRKKFRRWLRSQKD